MLWFFHVFSSAPDYNYWSMSLIDSVYVSVYISHVEKEDGGRSYYCTRFVDYFCCDIVTFMFIVVPEEREKISSFSVLDLFVISS